MWGLVQIPVKSVKSIKSVKLTAGMKLGKNMVWSASSTISDEVKWGFNLIKAAYASYIQPLS